MSKDVEPEGGMSRRKVLRHSYQGLAAVAVVGMGGLGVSGCVSVNRYVFRSPSKSNVVVIPESEMAQLKTVTDVLEIRTLKEEGPVFVRKVRGEYVALSSTCTHRGCEVESNPTFYECPCHNSKFDLEGRVVNGPATQHLDRLTLQKLAKGWQLKL